MLTRTNAILNLLKNRTHLDLANLYHHDMEVQVNVASDGGTKIDGMYLGARWCGWTDGLTTWKAFRIPYNANTEPKYEDKEIKFDLAEHAEGIGMTGWNWKERKSKWVAFDFDAITGHSDRHSKKLNDEELVKIREMVKTIPWVSLRYSTSGKGLHLYVFLEEDTANHNEHAALARSVLSTLSGTTGVDFVNKVDICGGNMWVWHRKMKGDGLKLIKEATEKFVVTPNWRENVPVITGKRRKSLPNFVQNVDAFDELCGKVSQIPLDEEHQRLIKFLEETKAQFNWSTDHHMLVCHTYDLKQAHNKLSLKGKFETLAEGTERGNDHNCFAYPMRKGAWSIRRFTPGVAEAKTWDQDGTKWTQCYFNRELDFDTACKINNGIEHPTGGYHFDSAENIVKTLAALGTTLVLHPAFVIRSGKMKQHREDGKLILEVEANDADKPDLMPGWIREKKVWKIVVKVNRIEIAEETKISYDDTVRHMITVDGDDAGWVIRGNDDNWNREPLSNVKLALQSKGLNNKETTEILGSAIIQPWTLVNIPFAPEYPGDRRWNKNAAQLMYAPNPNTDNLKCPTWNLVLDHVGKRLNGPVSESKWCKENNILTGADYLRVWIACLFQEPEEQVPYLFFFNIDQNTGKSTFHEMLQLLLTRGYIRANHALTSSGSFNGELENSVLCVVEEMDLRKNKESSERIKDWVTSKTISIHKKQLTPYIVPNTTHWVQVSNDQNYCPIFPGDTRIIPILVERLGDDQEIPKGTLIQKLKSEAPDFLASILAIEIPKTPERLRIPVIMTEEKTLISGSNESPLFTFLRDKCFYIPGAKVSISEFHDAFIQWLEPSEQMRWTKNQISKNMPIQYPKGRSTRDSQWYYGNLSLTPDAMPGRRLKTREDGALVEANE